MSRGWEARKSARQTTTPLQHWTGQVKRRQGCLPSSSIARDAVALDLAPRPPAPAAASAAAPLDTFSSMSTSPSMIVTGVGTLKGTRNP